MSPILTFGSVKYSEDELIEKYLATLHVEASNTKELFLLGFIGVIGSGKSYLAKKLSDKLSLFVASNDQIRRFLDDLKLDWSSPMQPTLQKIAEARTHYLFRNRVSHIQDADMIQFSDLVKENAARYGAKVFFINVVCPEEVILKRLERREVDLKNNPESSVSKSGVEQYFKRKLVRDNYQLPEIFFTIETSNNNDIDDQVNLLIGNLKASGVL